MEEKILGILAAINEEIPAYSGSSLFEAGLLDSFQVIELVSELEDAFDIEIDAKYVVEENFLSREAIVALVKRLMEV